MDAKNSAKTKIKSSFKQVAPHLEKLHESTSTEIFLRENKQNLPKDIAYANPHNIMCEAIDCYSKADTEVHLKVGTKGIIPLFLCTKCRSKLALDEVSADL
jgi:hypothetical protein